MKIKGIAQIVFILAAIVLASATNSLAHGVNVFIGCNAGTVDAYAYAMGDGSSPISMDILDAGTGL